MPDSVAPSGLKWGWGVGYRGLPPPAIRVQPFGVGEKFVGDWNPGLHPGLFGFDPVGVGTMGGWKGSKGTLMPIFFP